MIIKINTPKTQATLLLFSHYILIRIGNQNIQKNWHNFFRKNKNIKRRKKQKEKQDLSNYFILVFFIYQNFTTCANPYLNNYDLNIQIQETQYQIKVLKLITSMIMDSQAYHKIKVIVCSIPLAGHYIPILRIAEALANLKQFEVTFATSAHEFSKIKNISSSIKILKLEDDTQSILQKGQWKCIPLQCYDKAWESQLLKFIEQYKPKIIISDFMTSAIVRIGQNIGIPTILSMAVQSGVLSLLDFPTLRKNMSFFGLTIIYNSIVRSLIPKSVQPLVKFGPYFDRSLVLVTSFFGLQDAASLPPNIKMIGFTFSPLPEKKNFDQYISDWLLKMRNLKKPIIYITFGSVVKLSQKFINFLYDGLKKLQIGVLWSLKQGSIPQLNQNFLVRKWLPQLQILSLPEVKVVISHCGWGGVSQCIQTHKPMLCVPNYADQPHNALLVEKRGIGLILRNSRNMMLIHPETISQPKFTHKELQQKIQKLITDQSYVKNLEKLHQLMLDETGGIQQAIFHIKNAANNGVDHLVDQNLNKIRKRSMKYIVMFILIIIFFSFWNSVLDHPRNYFSNL